MVVDAEISLVQFVYPFLFEAKTLERRKEAVSKAHGRDGTVLCLSGKKGASQERICWRMLNAT
jgi:hypothetical protein